MLDDTSHSQGDDDIRRLNLSLGYAVLEVCCGRHTCAAGILQDMCDVATGKRGGVSYVSHRDIDSSLGMGKAVKKAVCLDRVKV